MIILYILDLLVVLIFSVGALTVVVTLSFTQTWKIAVGLTLGLCILASAAYLSFYASSHRQEAGEFSKLAQEIDSYLQKRNK